MTLSFCQTDQPSTVVPRRSLSRSSIVSIRSSRRSARIVRLPAGCDCSLFDGWSHEFEVLFRHGFLSPLTVDCSYNELFTNSLQGSIRRAPVSMTGGVRRLIGLSHRAAAKALNERGIKTATSKAWTAVQVIRVREHLVPRRAPKSTIHTDHGCQPGGAVPRRSALGS